MSLERLHPLPPVPSLPKLSTLVLHTDWFEVEGVDEVTFGRVASYLVHSAPFLRCLRLPDLSRLQEEWLLEDGQLLSKLAPLTQLKGLSLTAPSCGQREWKEELDRY